MNARFDIAIWIYGSHARGDADELSDFDILAVSDESVGDAAIRRIIGTSTHPSVTRYTWSEIRGMAEYGSLFLRHLHLEGQVVFESTFVRGRLSGLLSSVGDYKFAARDLAGFRTVLNDVRESLLSGGSLFFELSTLGSVFRHASILACSLSRSPCFSRIGPVSAIVSEWGLPEELAVEFPSLYRYRIYADGRINAVSTPSASLVRLWCARTDLLLDALQDRIDGAH